MNRTYYTLHGWIEGIFTEPDGSSWISECGSVEGEFQSVNRCIQWADKNLKNLPAGRTYDRRLANYDNRAKGGLKCEQRLVGFYVTKTLRIKPSYKFRLMYHEYWADRTRSPMDTIYCRLASEGIQ